MKFTINYLSEGSQILMHDFDCNIDAAINYAQRIALNAQTSNPPMSGQYSGFAAELKKMKNELLAVMDDPEASLTIDEMIRLLTLLGMARIDRSKILCISHEAGSHEALQEAKRQMQASTMRVAGAVKMARQLCGITI